MRFPRASGILLHPTSLPGPWGIGDLGSAAYEFVDMLVAAGQSLWQILPLGPTGYGDSPYQCFSAFAGNPFLISIDQLAAEGLLDAATFAEAAVHAEHFSPDQVDSQAVQPFKMALFRHSFELFHAGASLSHEHAFKQFCIEQASWLNDYALFMALKTEHDNRSWPTWEPELATREPHALVQARKRLTKEFQFQQYLQYLFFSQWLPLKAYANAHGIRIIGDAPIFVAYDSADVWANPTLFYLDTAGQPTVIAGVPPDYFSATGQRWGNPLYRWDRMAATGYAWWIERIRNALTTVDILRIDHFRGFAAYWEIPAEEETAINGHWVEAPGTELFTALEVALGELPLIAEDLGVITPDVEALRDRFHLPGMKVLQFAFGDDANNPYLPHNYLPNCIVYTGTHDNNTTLGWFLELEHEEREIIRRYLGHNGNDISWDMLRLALASVADTAIVPLQDILRMGSDARMNIPGVLGGNWSWRFHRDAISPWLLIGLRLLVETYGRMTKKATAATADAAAA